MYNNGSHPANIPQAALRPVTMRTRMQGILFAQVRGLGGVEIPTIRRRGTWAGRRDLSQT